MKHPIRICVFLVLALATASGQDLRISPLELDGRLNPFHVKWDSSFNRLVSYRDREIDTADMAGARIFDKDGKNVGAYPLKVFPDARWAEVWDAAATPRGGVVLSALLAYGPYPVFPDPYQPPVKHMLLTFAPDGKLVSAFETRPKSYLDKIVLDDKGNIYALGDADREGPYPLLVKYSPDGKILREFMPSSLFAAGDDVIDGSSENGEPRMWIKQSHLYVWLSAAKELLKYSVDGELLSRTSLVETLKRQAVDLYPGGAGYSADTEVIGIDTANNGDVICQCRFWSADGWDTKVLIVRITPDGQKLQQLGPGLDNFAAGELMAVSPKDELIFRKFNPTGEMTVSLKAIPTATGQVAIK